MKFLQISDPQLGCRQYGLESRYEDYIRVHDYIFKQARFEWKPDAIVYTGDIFEKSQRSSDLELYVRTLVRCAMEKLHAPVLGIEGNHDLLNTNSSLQICDICPLDEPETPGRVVEGVRFYGINYRDRMKDADLLEHLNGIPDGTQVLVLHQTLAEVCAIAADISAADLVKIVKPRGVRYIAMGHIHNSWIGETDGVVIGYSGSTEMTDIDENPEKFVFMVDMDKKGPGMVTMLPLPTRPIRRVVLETAEEIEALTQEIREKPDTASLLVLSVSRAISKYLPALEHAARKAGIPVTTKLHAPNMGNVAVRPFERAKMATDLRNVVAEKFPVESEQYAMAMALLDSPRNLVNICGDYLRHKGAVI